MVLFDVLDHANRKDRVALGGVLGGEEGGVKLLKRAREGLNREREGSEGKI